MHRHTDRCAGTCLINMETYIEAMTEKEREGKEARELLSCQFMHLLEWENTLGNVRIVFLVGLNFMGRQAGLLDYLHMRTGRDMWMMNESRGSWFILRSLTIAEI